MKFVYGITLTSTCPSSKEGDLIGKRWRVDEFQRQAVLLRELPRVGDEEGDVAENRCRELPLTVEAAWAEPGNPIIPAGTAIVIVPRGARL